jgi:hypothetical protein
MDIHHVKKSARDNSGKRYTLPLHTRIIEFAKIKGGIAEKLFALKWLGNRGSHQGGLTPKDLIVGFELMNYAVEELFTKRRQKLTTIAKKINRRKGPIRERQ